MRKKAFLIGGLSFVSLLIIITLLYLSEYDINEITPDNFRNDLQPIYSQSIFQGNSTVFLENPFFILNAKNEESNDTYKYTKYSATADIVEINDNRIENFWYSVSYDKQTKQPYQFSVNEINPEKRKVHYLPTVIKMLMERGEFTLKKTNLINGDYDILIKDLGNCFLIGMIAGKFENPSVLSFSLYSKKKFFKSLYKCIPSTNPVLPYQI